jgi:putative ABC transport system ATP-binding protein/lipoprotein-releasing system ATP-binding protein
MANAPQLRAVDVHRSFQIGRRSVDVLRGISMEVAEGECVFLCGASGAGKTTLLYTLAGLERPEGGEVFFETHNVYRLGGAALARLRNTRMGFVFQSYFLLPELTAIENVLVPALIGGRHARDRAIELLGRVGLADRADHLPAELSGGEQQRVAIARALINDPRVLFADEPTGNLDSHTGESIVELLLGIGRADRRTLVVVTHDSGLAQRGDRILRIEDGQIAG